jgi:demethylmenaquinone methyltransferase/2-methoxy-6-polyprenyl-1,4-benzoquinol methylase
VHDADARDRRGAEGVPPINKAPARIAGMFDAIAGRYDLLNLVLSAGLDRRWRRRAVRELALTGRERVLDMCTGTADLAIAAAAPPRGMPGARDVIGIDFAGEMLRRGLAKVRQAGLSGRVHLARGDATRIPLADASVDAATIAFGIRNVADPALGCAECHRVIRPGGRLAILEFGRPTVPVFRTVYAWYSRHVLPRVGRLVSRHADAYEYLPSSVQQFPAGEAFVKILRQAGFPEVRTVPLMLGVVYLYVARKGPRGAGTQHPAPGT